MDLLPGSSSSSEDETEPLKRPQHDSSSSSSSSPLPPVKRPKRGVVKICPSDQVPKDHFQRNNPHQRGKWSGHVFLPLFPTQNSVIPNTILSNSVLQFQKFLESQGYSGTIVQHDPHDLHISLSQPFALTLSNLDSFVNQLEERLALELASKIHLYLPQDASILVNDQGTRSFWGWTVPMVPILQRLVRHVDAVLERYNLPPYYDPPIFHVSIASFAGDLREYVGSKEELLRHYMNDHYNSLEDSKIGHGRVEEDDEDDSDDEDFVLEIPIRQVQCSFGTTKSFQIKLAAEG